MTGDGVDYVTLDQWVHLAAEVLGADAATIRRTADLNLIDKAAVSCWQLVNNHGLPDGNKRCAFVAMVVFLRRNDVVCVAPSAVDAVATMVAVASKQLDSAGLAGWIRSHTT